MTFLPRSPRKCVSLSTERKWFVFLFSQEADSWEIIEGLKIGQTNVQKPDRHEGFMLKKRKWPLKGWHKVITQSDWGWEHHLEILVVIKRETKVTGACEFETLKTNKTSKQKPREERRERGDRGVEGEKRKCILWHWAESSLGFSVEPLCLGVLVTVTSLQEQLHTFSTSADGFHLRVDGQTLEPATSWLKAGRCGWQFL